MGRIDEPGETYQIWPQKFLSETWELMCAHGLADLPLPNSDYPLTQEGGLLVMAKLADACAGSQFARVTDRLMAYGLIGSADAHPRASEEVVPITLAVIDASSIPMEYLIDLRRREATERRGRDYTLMRHNYADRVQAHAAALGAAVSQPDRDEMNRQFRLQMENELQDLCEALGRGKWDLVLKPVVLATLVAGGSMISGVGLPAAIAAGGAAAIGAEWKEIAASVSDFFINGFKFSHEQQEVMRTNPMAYMYSLSSLRS